ncbi:extracellular solute-binding protein [Actinotalea sp. BY-33]|uniref:Extracellular solute-binding protein n=1 Tax=Actinotalea soli TaxID=2819234 RepID=A0A939LTX3_9CELL|nr:extracellular solute-binding protein [Actinotalea soli]MBO1752610.1 extracellular solute-binding protein [Actinotalea soli]
MAVGAAAGALVLVLAACSSDDPSDGPAQEDGTSSGEPVELTFQSWVPNIDQAVDAFNAAHDDIHVELETITAGPDGGYATMISAVEAGNAADVAQVGYSSVADFLLADALEDITEDTADHADTFTAWQWQTGVFDERVYAVPQAAGPLGMFYREDIFTELGLEAPETWDQFYDAAQVVRASDPDRYIAAFAFNQSPWMTGLAQQSGAQWFTVEGDAWQVDLTDESTTRVAELWQRMIDEDLVKIEADMSSEWNADIQNGNVLSWISGSWADAIVRGTAPETAGSWGVAHVPQWEEGGELVSATWDGGSSSVVLRGTEHPAEAAEFALWLNSDPESVSILTSVGAGWPAIADTSQIDSLQDDPEVFDFYGGQNIWEVFAEADAAVDTSWTWPPLVSTLYASLTDNVSTAVEDGTDLTEAYAATEADMRAALEQRGINVAD